MYWARSSFSIEANVNAFLLCFAFKISGNHMTCLISFLNNCCATRL